MGPAHDNTEVQYKGYENQAMTKKTVSVRARSTETRGLCSRVRPTWESVTLASNVLSGNEDADEEEDESRQQGRRPLRQALVDMKEAGGQV